MTLLIRMILHRCHSRLPMLLSPSRCLIHLSNLQGFCPKNLSGLVSSLCASRWFWLWVSHAIHPGWPGGRDASSACWVDIWQGTPSIGSLVGLLQIGVGSLVVRIPSASHQRFRRLGDSHAHAEHRWACGSLLACRSSRILVVVSSRVV